MTRILAAALTVFVLFGAHPARADCISPARADGAIFFNSSYAVLQYCDGTDWVAMGPIATPAPGAPTAGLVGHWALDETAGLMAVDASGTGNNGTLENGPVWRDTGGRLAGTLDFDGSDDDIVVPDNPSLDIATALTISAWIWSDSWAQALGIENFILAKNDYIGGEKRSYNFNVTTAGKLRFETWNTNPAGSTGSAQTAFALATKRWYHVAVTYDRVNIKLYVDGALVETVPETDALTPNDNMVSIGRVVRALNTDYGEWDGMLDDVRLYNVALSEDDIRLLYNHGMAGRIRYNPGIHAMEYNNGADWVAMGPDKPGQSMLEPSLASGLVGHWTLNETTGAATAADSSGSSNGGTLSNMDPATDWVSGRLNNALDFDAVNDRVRVANSNASLRFTGNGSVAGWIKLKPNYNATGTVFQKQSDNPCCQWGMALEITNTRAPTFAVVHTDGGAHQHTLTLGAPYALATDQWYHLAGVWESPYLKIYINGELAQSLNIGTGTLRTGTTAPSCVGCRQPDSSTANFFNGETDDLRVYNRALTEGEVRLLSKGGKCLGPDRPEGTMAFNADHNVMQYCNGNEWTGIGK